MNSVVEVMEGNSGQNIIKHEDANLDLYLKIHNKINSKSEEISKSYSENILVKFVDVKELHIKTLQSIASSYPVKGSLNVRISVSHNEGESDKHNSFEEFEKHNITSPNPTSNITMIYIFTILDQQTQELENYKVINQLSSRIADLKQIEKEAPPFISSALISSMVTATAKITVQYSDYVKARHFTAMFDEWIKSCDMTENSGYINYFKSISHLITRFGKLTVYGLLAFFTVNAMDTQHINSDQALKFLIIYASIFVIIGGISETFLHKLEKSIDSHIALSYLDINKGDAKLITEYSNRNKASLFWGILGIIGTVGVGLLSSSVYDLIKWVLQ
jgi:hypothetical protein